MSEKTPNTKFVSMVKEIETELIEIEQRYSVVVGRIKTLHPTEPKSIEIHRELLLALNSQKDKHFMVLMTVMMLESEQRIKGEN